MSEDVAAQLALRDELRMAIELGQFDVLYQPIVSGPGGRIAAVEALVRWNHPTRGLVAPDAFIRVAEQTGLIVPIGRHVLEIACRDLAEWRRAGHTELTVHVNVSARQLAHADFVDLVLAVLDHAALPPQALSLEVTESTLIEDATTAETLFAALKGLGVAISLDDFGTGYSSLAYLKRFSIDNIKIDRSFVAGIPGDASDCALVEAILAIAEHFGAIVVAEGVETATQADWLRAHGCPLMQGWHFGRPMSAGDLLARLEAAPPRPTPLHRYRQG
jgi:EAL domain-containing protein (putative c-di-GMP-specific phosphodiesterase class I)